MNVVFLEGNLGDDPKVYRKGSGVIARMRLATSKQKKVDDKVVTKTTWHTVIAYGKLAEECESLHKGSALHVRGELSLHEYERQDRTTGSEMQVVAVKILVPLGSKQPAPSEQPQPAAQGERKPNLEAPAYGYTPARLQDPPAQPSQYTATPKQHEPAPAPTRQEPSRPAMGSANPQPAVQAPTPPARSPLSEIPEGDVFADMDRQLREQMEEYGHE